MPDIVYRCYINDYCIKCAACIETAPRWFRLTDRGVNVTAQPQNQSMLKDFREAEASCPVGAVVIDVWPAGPSPRAARARSSGSGAPRASSTRAM